MNNLEKYLDQVIEQKPVVYEPPVEVPQPPEEPPTINLLASVRRRWYIVLAVTIVLSAVALPAIWLVIEPQYVVQGAVKVRPVVPGILPTDSSSSVAEIGSYGEFVNTQAIMLMSNSTILASVADDLSGRNLAFLSGTPQSRMEKLIALVQPVRRNAGPERMLRDAISKKKITAVALPRTELIAVAMRTAHTDEAKTIVDSFIRNYVAQSGTDAGRTDNQNLSLLDRQRSELAKRITDQRQKIRDLADQYGTTVLGPRQEMELNRQNALLTELTRLESLRVAAEANVTLAEKTEKVDLSPEQAMNMRRDHVNSDPMVAEWSRTIVGMERDLITEQSKMKVDHPKLSQEQVALDSLKQKLADKKKELEQEFDNGLEARLKDAARQHVETAKMELERINAQYTAFSDRVNQQDTQTQKVGKASLDIQDRELDLGLNRELYDTLSRRIRTLEIEQQRPARVETAYFADVVETNDRRPQLATAAVIGALACGLGLGFLRDRMDKTLQTPEDVTRQLDLPIIGTTTSSRTVKPALFAEQIAGDYQIIRTNLGLLNDGGLPRRLVVSSAGTREGKTTFAVNLATSLAKSGKKVLLIDGDLRKPDVAQMLSIPKDTQYLQDVLQGADASHVVYVSPTSGLHVLAGNPRHLADPYELLTSSMAAEQIEKLAREYDHIVIDSPPALAFPDALVWAKLADAVVLVSFAGQTTAPELKEAKERFTRGRARVLGAVLSNVPVDQSLYRYAYTYRSRSTASGRKAKKMLLATQPSKSEGAGGVG
jgi:polysaccharide biosynthesis transport protein